MLTRLKRITGYAAHARHCAEEDPDIVGYIPRQTDIESPYAYSPVHPVFCWDGRLTIIVETKHRQYDVFQVPASMVTDEETATQAYIASKRERA